MEKLDKFVRDYHCSKADKLPRVMKKRLNALKKIQLEQIHLVHKYHKEIHELEMKYDKLYKPLYEKRAKIINGEHEPTEEECQLPENLKELYDSLDDQENTGAETTLFTPDEDKELDAKVKGLPGFWLGCLNSSYSFADSIEPADKLALKHLEDIRLVYGKDDKDDLLTYALEFVFSENPYFTNKVLTKTYYLKLSPDDKDPFSYEGFEVIKSDGCEINWKEGQNITVKTVTVKQENKKDGRSREKKKEVEKDSFFLFFKPPTPPADEKEEEEINGVMAVDFELGEIIRQNFIPRAALIYSGYVDDEDDDDEDDYDDEDDSLDESCESDQDSDQ